MYRVFKIMAVSLNAVMVAFFAFFMFSLIEEGKAGNMAGAETLVSFELIEEVETLYPKLIGNDEQAICMALNIYYESRSDN